MPSLQRPSTKVILLLLLVGAVLYCFFITYVAPPYPFRVPRVFKVDPVPTRRDLARKLLKIQRQIEYKTGITDQVDPAWAKELMDVIRELDPRVKNTLQIKSAENSKTSGKDTPNVCSEVYMGKNYDASLEHNFIEEKCEAKKFSEVLTVIVITKGWESNRTEFVIKNIRKYYDNNIIVAMFGSYQKLLHSSNVTVEKFDREASEAFALNQIIPLIKTPYTLIVNSLTHFNDQSALERLVRVLDNLDEVVVASGAYRNIRGYWHHGCLQITAENYELGYIRGYEHSSHECMYCDDVLGPFVTKSNFLKNLTLTEEIGDGPALYRDWFLSVRLTGKLVVSCPDVMFFVEYEPALADSDWHAIARKWSFQHIHSFDGKDLEIPCDKAQISCTNLKTMVSSFLLPPCCRKKVREMLNHIIECAEELGLYYELNHGTLLAAVKMDSLLPWDFDADIITDCAEEKIWSTKGFLCMARKGCIPAWQKGHYWMARCRYSTIDVTCWHNINKTLPEEYRQVTTKAQLDGHWVSVSSNPAKKTRNIFGPEYLKHAVHWRYVGDENSTDLRGHLHEITGAWSTCAEPGFHSCLDHFPVDGNIRFKSPFCRVT